MHSGHYNALRQAKMLGDILVAGIHSDLEINTHKGPTIMNDEERLTMLRACKWVDEIAFDVPYAPTIELLNKLNCDFVVHGDDMPVTSDGHSAYGEVIKGNRCKIIKRTEGISTTNLLGRVLDILDSQKKIQGDPSAKQIIEGFEPEETSVGSSQNKSEFFPTVKRIYQFSKYFDQDKIEKPPQKIVYVSGAFDLFNFAHVAILEKARKLGDYLIVGLHSIDTGKKHRKYSTPFIMSLHERLFNLLSCKYVDDVVIDAPWEVTQNFITTFGISVVVGLNQNTSFYDPDYDAYTTDPYAVPKGMDMYQEIEVSLEQQLNYWSLFDRIAKNKTQYRELFARKKIKEQTYNSTCSQWRKNMQEI